LAGHAIASGDFVISRASVSGPGARTVDLGRSLSRLHIVDVTLGDEILLIPKMRCRTRLSTAMPASHFAAGLTEELRKIRREALVDPAHGFSGDGALRFTNHDRYAAWLVTNWLQPGSVQLRQLLAELLNGQTIEQWQRRTVLNDGVRVVRLVRALAVGRCEVNWVDRLSHSDCITVMQALGRAYGFEPATLLLNWGESSNRSVSVSGEPPKRISPLLVDRTMANDCEPTVGSALIRSVLLGAKQVGEPLFSLSRDRQEILLTALVLAQQPGLGALMGGRSVPSLARLARDFPRLPISSLTPFGNRQVRPLIGRQRQSDGVNEKHRAGRKALASPQMKMPAACNQRIQNPQAARPKVALAALPQSVQIPAAEAYTLLPAGVSQLHTEFGGLMFVINILLALKLYPDFTLPLGRRLQPSPFWLLAIGVRWFGRSFRRDPLFGLLCEIGQSGLLPKQWKVEQDWLAGLGPKGILIPLFEGKNLTYWDSRGFIFSDLAANSWSRKAIGMPVMNPSGNYRLPAKRNNRWVACLASFLNFRIKQAAPDLVPSTLRLPAKVTLTEDGLNLHFSLAELPLAVRMAGLDRNPGWLPSEGRIIAFHFT
jgi:hypothetical protein